jgi:hypothetical protein
MENNEIVYKLQKFFPDYRFKIINKLVIDECECASITWSQESNFLTSPELQKSADEVLLQTIINQVSNIIEKSKGVK